LPKLVCNDGKAKLLPAVHPNVGIQMSYQRRLDRLLERMNRSINYWLAAQYWANPPELAMDASSAADFIRTLGELGTRWMKRFNQAAEEMAKWFAQDAFKRSDAAMAKILKDAGWTVKFKPTRIVNDALQATIGAQVGLIKSIGQQHLSDVQGIVMRSVQMGGDLGTLTDELQKRYALTRKRAALIARDQNNKANATITRVRQQELGIERAVWVHSGGGKEPRPKHLAFANGQLGGPIYEINKGAMIGDDGGYTWPRYEINCRCI